MRFCIGLRATVRLLFFVTGFVLSSGCTKPCGSVRDGMSKYHDVCVAVDFREHVERTENSKSKVEDFGLGYDLAGDQVDLVGDRVRKLKPHNLYNLRGDFVEVDAKTRLRVYGETDVNSANLQLVVILAGCLVAFFLYRWSLTVSSRTSKKTKK